MVRFKLVLVPFCGTYANSIYVESSDSDDHFSDAQSGLDYSGRTSPVVPLTRVERVDNEPSHGEVPRTGAFDEVAAVIPEGAEAGPQSPTPGEHPIPLVEKVDPSSPSNGEVPGTSVHDKPDADAVPDMVITTGELSRSSSTRSRAGSRPGDLPIPITPVEKVDSEHSLEEVPGTKALELRIGNAEPEIVEEIEDGLGENVDSPLISERLTSKGRQPLVVLGPQQ